MSQFHYPFAFTEEDSSMVRGSLELEQPLPISAETPGSGFYRPAKIVLESGPGVEIVFYHSLATEKFIYLRSSPVDANLLAIAGLSEEEIARIPGPEITLPGQLCLGSARSNLIGQAIRDVIGSPAVQPVIAANQQHNLAVFPIAREGLKYQVAKAIYDNYADYCDEIILDAHHVFDSSVPVYGRKVEMTLFKDKDLDRSQRENVRVAFIADSIASGLVMMEVITRIKERFTRVEQVEVLAPLATVRGLCRVARSGGPDLNIRLHVFETLLNALPPDYYYSAHFNLPEFHIQPELEKDYRAWWGTDADGNFIADTACAGYGWSEAFFSPRKQIQMMNGELTGRHNLTIADILRRNLNL